MENKKSRINGINLIGVLVDQYDGKDCSGRMVHQYSEEEFPFRTLMEMMGKMEHQYDDWDYPEAALETRTFIKHRKENSTQGKWVVRTRLPQIAMNQTAIDIGGARGKFATFQVLVRMRQNATWQGSVYWVDQDKIIDFRSALEFARFIDSALYEMV